MFDGSKFDTAKVGDKFTDAEGDVWLMVGLRQEGPISYEFVRERDGGHMIGHADYPKIDALTPSDQQPLP